MMVAPEQKSLVGAAIASRCDSVIKIAIHHTTRRPQTRNRQLEVGKVLLGG
jgi:hypothetical protein